MYSIKQNQTENRAAPPDKKKSPTQARKTPRASSFPPAEGKNHARRRSPSRRPRAPQARPSHALARSHTCLPANFSARPARNKEPGAIPPSLGIPRVASARGVKNYGPSSLLRHQLVSPQSAYKSYPRAPISISPQTAPGPHPPRPASKIHLPRGAARRNKHGGAGHKNSQTIFQTVAWHRVFASPRLPASDVSTFFPLYLCERFLPRPPTPLISHALEPGDSSCRARGSAGDFSTRGSSCARASMISFRGYSIRARGTTSSRVSLTCGC